MRYLFIIIMLSACGLPRQFESHKDFDNLKHKFEQETGVPVTVPIIYDGLESDTVALCEVFDDGYKVIRINTMYWDEMGEGGKEETVYHELGHCQLNRGHSELLTRTNTFVYPIPNSIMYPYMFGDASFYWIFRDHYIEELMFPDKRLGR